LKVSAVPLALPEIAEIDGLSYFKAGTILDEARSRLKAYDYDLGVRRSQEAFELYLKSLFRYLQAEYPASHDLKKQIYELTEALKQYQIDRRQIARLVLANSILDLWRSPAFYGDEKLNVGGLFNDVEATLAISYAELAQLVCAIVRGYVYQRAVPS
jgi:HEPN domain-containing protein